MKCDKLNYICRYSPKYTTVEKTRNFGESSIVEDVEDILDPASIYRVAIYYIAGIGVNVSDVVRCAMQSLCNDYI